MWKTELQAQGSLRKLAVASLAAIVISFLLFSWMFDRGIIDIGAVKFTAAHTASYARDLADCAKRERSLVNKGSREKCLPIAKDLLIATQSAPREGYDYYKRSTFEAFLTGRHLTLVKASCSDDDLVVKTFAWNAVPLDPSQLPADRKQYGSFSGAIEFSDLGYRTQGACLLVIEFPVDRLKSFNFGQWERSTGIWRWRVAY